MKKTLLVLGALLLSTNMTFAEIEDDSIEKELDKTVKTQTDFNINLKSFKTCANMETVLEGYIKAYWEKNKNRYRGGRLYRNEMMTDDMAVPTKSESAKEVTNSKPLPSTGGWSDDYSKTNTQVEWVDESDITKTDGKYIYYYSHNYDPASSAYPNGAKYIYVTSVKDKKLVKKIKIPKTFNNVQLYLNNGKLVILANGYKRGNYNGYYINRSQKTYTIVYDVTDIPKLKLEKIYAVDGYFAKSRMIGDKVYVVSNNSFNIPYYDFKSVDDIKIDAGKIIPKKIDLSYTTDKTKHNYKKYPYHVSAGNVASCNEIEYVLPDEKTLEKYDFSPSYNIISVIDTADTSVPTRTKVVASDNAKMYMSTENMYLASNMYSEERYSCPAFARCIMPYYNRGQNTLVHKFALNNGDVNYKKSTLIPGRPLTQYSMDEYKGNFRILTQTNNWNSKDNKKFTGLYILDKDLQLTGKLEDLGKGENFKSSRYMGEKLFLVTFKDIDPFFVIDVANPKAPKVLGELKMPGYSTYLHPYDDKHIIGLGYDTVENKWGGTQNGGLKLDLYEINYDKKCGDSDLTAEETKKCKKWDYKGIIAKQKFSKVFGGKGSHSEATRNPRMFMWNAGKGKLLLPLTLRNGYGHEEDEAKNADVKKDSYEGMIAMNINKDSGIQEAYRISHLDEVEVEKQRQEKCKPYTNSTDKKVCKKLLNGEEYCYTQTARKPPSYCFADSTLWDYYNRYSWNFRNTKIKRALWIGNQVFTLSDNKIQSSNLETGKEEYSVEYK